MRLSICRTLTRTLAAAATAMALTLAPTPPAQAYPVTWIGPYATTWDCEDAYYDYMNSGDAIPKTEGCQSRFEFGTWDWYYGIIG